ncbi:MAG: hypothetical protein N2606_00775 [Candidatus Omnitrophica bacterium]|nr:hypothetical protein [Candidatus Omnitrophota bacterium]
MISIRKSIIISLTSHFFIISFFSFYFTGLNLKISNPTLQYWTDTLLQTQTDNLTFIPSNKKSLFFIEPAVKLNNLGSQPEDIYRLKEYNYRKPPADIEIKTDEKKFIGLLPEIIKRPMPRPSSIMFHPLLPYQLQLYFRDRQAVHIELQFQINQQSKRTNIHIKRKISSGNLEADLLSIRSIYHYLFIQQALFIPNKWQTVSIYLSSKND